MSLRDKDGYLLVSCMFLVPPGVEVENMLPVDALREIAGGGNGAKLWNWFYESQERCEAIRVYMANVEARHMDPAYRMAKAASDERMASTKQNMENEAPASAPPVADGAEKP